MPSFNEKDNPIELYRDFGGLNKHHGSPRHTRLDKVNDMYPVNWTSFNHSDVEKSIEKILGPLSLFAPTSNEDEAPVIKQLLLERPVTPIDEEIKVQPQNIDQMIQYIRRRIMAKEDVPFLSLDDQKHLAAIIIGEVNGVWPEIRKQIDDPFLTPQENKELFRRIAVYVVTACEQLFHHYLHKAQVLNSRGVFSGPANTSRLNVQLALEASELLNILKIRRYIINDIRADSEKREQTQMTQQLPSSPALGRKLTYKTLLESSHSRTKCYKPEIKTTEHEIKEIQSRMPVLNMSHLTELLTNLPEKETLPSKDLQTKQSLASDKVSHSPKITKHTHKQKTVFKRSKSQPEFDASESTLDELCINQDVKIDPLLSFELELLMRERRNMEKATATQNMTVQDGSHSFIENDLRKLTESQPDDCLLEDDLPPLVQVITRHAKHDDLKQRMEKQLAELESRQKNRVEEECVHVQVPSHPQPDTVNVQLGTSGVIRASDIRVSERICMSSITLKPYTVVYNDLLDEINQETVNNLDSNLSMSDEIQEVYKEIMKTVSTAHMDLDDDPLVLNVPESLDITNTMTSATLLSNDQGKVINPTFQKDKEPPWTDTDRDLWIRTPVNPPKDIRGEDLFVAVTPNLPKINSQVHSFKQMKQSGKLSPADEKMYRSYVSWQQWWKSTATGNDYMKYLSIQETDFLGAIFHFYDSEDDETVNEELSSKKLQSVSRRKKLKTGIKVSAKEKEKLSRLKELRSLKSEFKQGFWNANSILMGGLGKDPELEENSSVGDISLRKVESVKQNKIIQHKKWPDKRDHISNTARSIAKKYKNVISDSDPQERLESVWQWLLMPDNLRLDMAIKYSCNNYYHKLPEAIDRWEAACQLILQRETLLVTLEKFERQASDPNRFFAKDSKNSVYRLEESRQRANLCKKIDALDTNIREEIEYIHRHFQDIITYQGRPYLDKMKWDRTEMLYWLAEERKQNGMKYEMITKRLNPVLKPAQLQPILPSEHS